MISFTEKALKTPKTIKVTCQHCEKTSGTSDKQNTNKLTPSSTTISCFIFCFTNVKYTT